jgi:alpha-D-xyloside xylohydrolase
MKRRSFLATAAAPAAAGALAQAQTPAIKAEAVLPGVWKISLGKSEAFTPVRSRRRLPAKEALEQMPHVAACPVSAAGITTKRMPRGFVVTLPLEGFEMVYGLGLQLQSKYERGKKKTLRVNADPRMDSGDSHAPVPFYVTTKGYGVLVDTARYATFWCGGKPRKGQSKQPAPEPMIANEALKPYVEKQFHVPSQVIIDVPAAEGVDLYVFAGPTMREAVARYNLFSGGGCVPSKPGLGVWYRVDLNFKQDEVIAMADSLRESRIPCDVLGLEPGWQTHAYSCSFVWNQKFPDPKAMVAELGRKGYGVNLWEHAYTHPTSPIYDALMPYSADYEVFGGLAPDLTLPEARKIFTDFHDKTHVALGVTGYKLDECDNSDYTGSWSFPEMSRFPSGMDGEQAHSRYGFEYQQMMEDMFARRNLRTYGLVRCSGALAAPLPYVLYSDLYDHREFIRGVVNSGFSGLLWTPEVRDAQNPEDLIRRIQSVVFSPMALVNAWYIRNPPWKQVDPKKNNAGELEPNWQDTERVVRQMFELRMRLVPYLYAAFVKYRLEGVPPFRALVVDYPAEPRTWDIDDAYLVGESLLVAPVVAGVHEREVFLPAGDWYDFWTGKALQGGRTIKVGVPLEQIPVFVKSGSILPLAEITQNAGDPASRNIEARVYGGGANGYALYEDDGVSLDYRKSVYNRVQLSWNAAQGKGSAARTGSASVPAYEVKQWIVV